MKITVSIPPSVVENLRRSLRRLEIPESELTPGLRRAMTKYGGMSAKTWIGSYVYKDRSTAERIARSILGEDGCRLEMSFWEDGAVATEYVYPKNVSKMVAAGQSIVFVEGGLTRTPGWYLVDLQIA